MIKVVDLTKVYKPKKGIPVTALNEVNLEFSETGMVFLLGKSGSGKSTLLNLIGGLDSYSSGDIIIKGKSTNDFKQSNFDSYRNTLVGFIFQEFNILEEFSVGKNIALALELQHKPSDRTAVEQMLEKVDIGGYYDRKSNELSGGQKQRVAIARALIKNPDIIMADEPTGSLDSNTGKQVFDTLKKLSKEKLVIVVSHDRENAELYGDRIIELADGKVITDRIRSFETGELVEQPVSVIDDKLIKVKAGKKLSTEEITLIVAALEKSTDDVYLSLDSNENGEFAKRSELTNNGASTFTETLAEQIKTKEYNPDDLKLTKSRLPIKDSFKLGASSLGHKKFRLINSIFLSFLTFIMVGFCISASFFDSVKVELKTANDAKLSYVILQKTTSKESRNSVFGMSAGYTEDEIKKFEQLSGKKALNLFGNGRNYFNISLLNNFANYQTKQDEIMMYYANKILNFVVVEEDTDLGFNLLGRKPTAGNEIVITDYIADSFIEYGYSVDVTAENKVTETINSVEQLIGKKLNTAEGSSLLITGIYQMPMKEKFNEYKDKTQNMFTGMAFDSTSIMMGFGYVSPNFSFGREYSEDLHYGNFDVLYGNDKIMSSSRAVSAEATENTRYITGYSGILADNQMIIPQQNMQNMGTDSAAFLKLPKDKRMVTLVCNGRMEKKEFTLEIVGIDEDENAQQTCIFSNNFIKKIKSITEKTPTLNLGGGSGYILAQKTNKQISHGGQVSAITTLNGYNNNQSGDQNEKIYWGKTNGVLNQEKALQEDEIIIPCSLLFDGNYSSNTTYQLEEIIEKYDALTSKEILLFREHYINYKKDGTIPESYKGKAFKIAGVCLKGNNLMVTSDKFFNDEYAKLELPNKIVIAMPTAAKDKAKFEKLLKEKSEQDEYGDVQVFVLGTHISSIISQATSLIDGLVTVFKYVSIGLIIFAALLMMNFITTSISYKKKEIGVLRAIGARGSDIFKIFFAESSIIAMIITILSWVGLTIIAVVVNKSLMISVLVLNPLVYLSMAAICFAVAFLSTYIPVIKIAKMKPIDTIHNK